MCYNTINDNGVVDTVSHTRNVQCYLSIQIIKSLLCNVLLVCQLSQCCVQCVELGLKYFNIHHSDSLHPDLTCRL